MLSKLVPPLIVAGILTGCASTNGGEGGGTLSGPSTTQDKLGHAITSPLADFNIMQTEIPPVVKEAVKNPYHIPDDMSCKVLAEQIHELDAALGADLDAVVESTDKSAAQQGGAFVEDEGVGAVQRTIEGVIPFRSWIRKFSGADKRSKEVNAAIAAGIVRRAFLKGMGQEHGCQPPAAPLRHPADIPAANEVKLDPGTLLAPKPDLAPESKKNQPASAVGDKATESANTNQIKP